MAKRWDELFQEAYLQASQQGGETARALMALKAKKDAEDAERGNRANVLQAAGNALTGFSAPFLNLPWKPLEAPKVGGVEMPLPSEVWKEAEAINSFKAWQKQQSGAELTEYDRQLLGLGKEKNEKPSDMDIWRQAQNETLQSLGGSSMVGILQESRGQYYPKIEERYLELKKQFGTISQEDYQTVAKKWLRRKGYVVSEANVTNLLKSNSNNLNFLFEKDEPAPKVEKKGFMGWGQ